MNVAIMQPYFLPYIGYFQLMAAVDQFLVYDNIEYTKKGWINRNRMLVNGAASTFSLPLKKASDFLDVREREIAPDFDPARLLNQFKEAYRKAPYRASTLPLLEKTLLFNEKNLFRFIYNSIIELRDHLGIHTPVVISSTVTIPEGQKSQDKVLAYCRQLGATGYLNPIGGVELYERQIFAQAGIGLNFLKSTLTPYAQFGNEFVPALSIIDVLMFNSRDVIARLLKSDYAIL